MRKAMIVLGVAGTAIVAVVGLVVMSLLMMLTGKPPEARAERPGRIAGISEILLEAYHRAAQSAGTVAPQCRGMRWQVLAGVAQIESNNAAGHTIGPTGVVTPPIIGPRLDGSGAGGNTTAIRDTDQGVWDRDAQYDAAVGVLQFIPSSWRQYGRDGNGDGVADPHNVFDNALGAVIHLCGKATRNFADLTQLRDALYGYNRSWSYVDRVANAIATFDATTPNQPHEPDLSTGTGRGAAIVAAAMKWIGTEYSWGGGSLTGPSRGFCCSPNGSSGANIVGFDCSGLSRYAAAQAGVKLPRTAAQQATVGQQIPRSAGLGALQPGDLLFFGFVPELRGGIHHVGIYVGRGMMVNAARPGTRVRLEPIWDDYAGASRIV